jgi:hypothetical protein
MGGKSTTDTTQVQNSTSAPWAASQPFLNGLLGQLSGSLGTTGLSGPESSALGTIETNASNASQFNPQLTSLVSNLFAGGNANAQVGNIQSNLDAYKSFLTPMANGSMVGSNPALRSQLDTIANDVSTNVNGQFAAAGRDASGLNQQTLARGIAQGEAPVIANQYNQDRQNQLDAATALYGAGNTTAGLLSGWNQQALANQQAGAALAPAAFNAQNAGANAILAAEAQRRGIPVQALGLLASIGVPIARLGSQSSGINVGHGENQMSGAQQFSEIAKGVGGLAGAIPNVTSGLGSLANFAKLLFPG